MLVVVNPYATTVSDRLKHLVVYALQSRFEVTAVETEGQNHATDIARQAAEEGTDLVVAFGGDGTVNEVTNGLVGTDVPLSVLPGGSTNVCCRSLGVPRDIVKATEHLLKLDNGFSPRRIDLGCVNGRYFAFGSGVGLDADAVREIDRNPWLKGRFKDVYYTSWLLRVLYGSYLNREPLFKITCDNGETVDSVTAIIQNCVPYTYFGSQKLEICKNVTLGSGTLSCASITKFRQIDLPTIISRAFSSTNVIGHRKINHLEGLKEFRLDALPTKETGEQQTFPLHVDGDYLGKFSTAEYSVHPGALAVIA